MRLVSIIIPVYNVSQYIVDSFTSALNQTYADIEYIVVDDCSTDNSIDILERLIEHNPRKEFVKIITHDVNKGLSEARNSGLKASKGDFIYFMDSDDQISKKCIELHINAILKNDADVTIGNISLIGGKSIHISSITASIENVKYPLTSFFNRTWSVSACNKLIKREIIVCNNLLFNSGLIHEDILWSYQLLSLVTKIAFVEEKTYIYLLRSNSLTTSSHSINQFRSIVTILNYISNSVVDNNIGEIVDPNLIEKYMIFSRLNASILLSNFNESYTIKNQIYQEINSTKLEKYSKLDAYSVLLKLPLWLFLIIMSVPYKSYKLYRQINAYYEKRNIKI